MKIATIFKKEINADLQTLSKELTVGQLLEKKILPKAKQIQQYNAFALLTTLITQWHICIYAYIPYIVAL